MSMEDAVWDIEERAEDAVVAYLKTKVSMASLIQGSFEITTAKYPLIVVESKDSDNHTEDGEFTARRVLEIDVHIVTEALNLNGKAGTEDVYLTARELHRKFKSSVIGTIAGTIVYKDLNALEPEGVRFSQAVMTTQTKEAGDGMITTTQTLLCIIQPWNIGDE